MAVTHVDLEAKEIRILVQSLDNCLKTCEVHKQQPNAHCEDCDAARALQSKLQGKLKA